MEKAMMRKRIVVLVVSLLLMVVPLMQSHAAPVVPKEDAASARLKVPQGFAVRLYATNLNIPRLMTVGTDGTLYVAERGAAQITRLEDKNGDGIAEAITPTATQLKGVHNL